MLVNEKIYELIENKKYLEIKTTLAEMHPGDISDIIEELPAHFGGILFRLLPKDMAVSVFENLDSPAREMLLHSLKSEEIANILNEMSPDDRTRLFEELPAHIVKKYLAMLDDKERKIAYQLLGYKDNTAGRLMTPDFVDLHEQDTVDTALATIRHTAPNKETIYYSYVMTEHRKLTGVISLRKIITSPGEAKIGDLMSTSVIAVSTDTHQEEVASIMAQYDLLAIPVVDLENRLVGIITHDDILDVIQEEDTKDIHLMGGVSTHEKSLLELSIWDNIKRRAGWLIILILVESFSSNIIKSYEDALSAVVALSFFIPMLIDTGGNAGTQSATVVIRAIATGEIEKKDSWKVLGKELISGLILGVLLGFLGGFKAFLSHTDPLIGITVGCSLLVVVALASITGALLPMIAVKLNLDPAVMAGPFITTVVDIVGLMTYFEIAKSIMNI